MSRAIEWYLRSSKSTKIWSIFKLFSAVDVASYFDERHFPVNLRSSISPDHLGLKNKVVELFKSYRSVSNELHQNTTVRLAEAENKATPRESAKNGKSPESMQISCPGPTPQVTLHQLQTHLLDPLSFLFWPTQNLAN